MADPAAAARTASKPKPAERRGPAPDEPTNPQRSGISGGGGERDRHHTHDPKTKG